MSTEAYRHTVVVSVTYDHRRGADWPTLIAGIKASDRLRLARGVGKQLLGPTLGPWSNVGRLHCLSRSLNGR
jgi:hypothetical protein